MYSLIVTAHPSSLGNTHKLAARYAAGREAAGGTALIMDLYAAEWKQDFLMFETPRDMNERASAERIEQEIDKAAELVLICPMWWGSFPAVMKNFIDQNFTPNFAYTYREGTHGPLRLPKGLLKGKRVKVVMTADGPTWAYMLLKPFFTFTFRMWVVRFCGMRLSSFTIIGDMFKKKEDKEVLQATLENIIQKII